MNAPRSYSRRPTTLSMEGLHILLDGGMTVGTLTVLAADLDLNTTNIGLVGLVQTGIEYSL
jgi:hypothetical protein